MKLITLIFLGLVEAVFGGEIIYNAAVVEFAPDQTSLDIKERINNNLDGFENVLKETKEQKVQIVVFPEDGISGLAPMTADAIDVYFEDIPEVSPLDIVNPCLQSNYNDRPILQRLSCCARKYEVVLVANMGDKKLCNRTVDPWCPTDGMYLYNTDVVFEMDGSLIAKYHKINLYSGEKTIFKVGNATNGVSFHTNFGVTFGIFTCFDILYKNPSECLLHVGVKNFIFPTAWGNSFPYYMSTVVQQGWSFHNGVNLLAANLHVNIPLGDFYGTGSGIYSAGVAKKYFMTGKTMEKATGKVLISELYAEPSMDNDKKQQGSVTSASSIKAKFGKYATFKTLNKEGGAVNVSSVYNGMKLTCSLSYKIDKESLKDEQYALGAYIGDEETGFSGRNSTLTDSESRGDFAFAVCFITKCDSDLGCGHITSHSSTIFEYAQLEGDFPPGSKPYSSAFASDFELIDTIDISIANNWTTLTICSPKNLLAVGLWTMMGHTASVCNH